MHSASGVLGTMVASLCPRTRLEQLSETYQDLTPINKITSPSPLNKHKYRAVETAQEVKH